jgi:hypothetical protein
MKLLDIYRTSHVTDFKMPLGGCEELSAFMQEETLEPLALSAPTTDEVVILCYNFLKWDDLIIAVQFLISQFYLCF